MIIKKLSLALIGAIALLAASCGGSSKNAQSGMTDSLVSGPDFNADSAYLFTSQQCDFGPRIMNSKAHDLCADYIVSKFEQYGCKVTLQDANLKGYDGTNLKSRNIIASINPEAAARILICAHWDSRPWADNDPDPMKHHDPVMAANDGASGVAVMIEMARIISQDSTGLNIGVDFICFDAEDYGTPQWAEHSGDDDKTWALGAQYWAANPHVDGYKARYGILLDMVGGQGAQFYQEGFSLQHAQSVVNTIWNQAEASGFSSFFIKSQGGYITDDHSPINEVAGIPCVDIINYSPDCQQSTFGPTWHTVSDDMEHIDRNTLKAVGQTVIDVIYNEK